MNEPTPTPVSQSVTEARRRLYEYEVVIPHTYEAYREHQALIDAFEAAIRADERQRIEAIVE